MSLIVLATASAQLEQRVHAATSGTLFALPFGPLPRDPAHLFSQLHTSVVPDVLVLDCHPDPLRALSLAADFDHQFPGISVILVSDLGAKLGMAAMRAGVRDIVDPAADIDDLRLILDQASHAAKPMAAAQIQVNGRPGITVPIVHVPVESSRVISVVSPKGGVGKTTVATNLAVGLAQGAPHSTVLVDLDVQFGDVASALNLTPEYSLVDAVHGPASRDTMVLKTFLALHETGVYVLAGPPTPAAADAVTAAEVGNLLTMLASEFPYVVVDTAPGLSEHALAAMDHTTDLVLLTSMDVPGVRGLRKELDTLTDLGMFPDARHIVLNLADARGGLSVDDVQTIIGTKVDLVLPRSKVALASVNQGIPLLQSDVNDPLTKQLHRLVGRFVPPPAAAKTRRGRWGKDRTEAPDHLNGSHPRRAAPRWYRARRAGVS